MKLAKVLAVALTVFATGSTVSIASAQKQFCQEDPRTEDPERDQCHVINPPPPPNPWLKSASTTVDDAMADLIAAALEPER